MAQPTIYVNPYSGIDIPIYDFHTNSRIGTLNRNELCVYAGYRNTSRATGPIGVCILGIYSSKRMGNV